MFCVSEILRSPVFAATAQCRVVTLPKTIILPSPQKTIITGFEASSPSFGSRLSRAWLYANSKRYWSARKQHAYRERSWELLEYEHCPCAGKTYMFHELSVFKTVSAAPVKQGSKLHNILGNELTGPPDEKYGKTVLFALTSRLTFSLWFEFGRALRPN